ncbi:hypothetical protein ACFYT4_31320 [Streptomyces sp. NPDC004609]|uniref:hypothetical protein n=1 Tax=Streptomyces sp. NPDC004609 TaxID=3364704 RepID=UPI0036B1E3F1
MSATFLTGIARTTEPRVMLRRFLALDAVVTGGNGLAYAVASGPIGRLLGVDDRLLLGLGVFLTVFGLAVGALAARQEPPAFAVKVIVDMNVVWAVLSIASLAIWLNPSTAGAVWIPMQALVVGGFAALQWAALRAGART